MERHLVPGRRVLGADGIRAGAQNSAATRCSRDRAPRGIPDGGVGDANLVSKEGDDVNHCHFPRHVQQRRGARQAGGRAAGVSLYQPGDESRRGGKAVWARAGTAHRSAGQTALVLGPRGDRRAVYLTFLRATLCEQAQGGKLVYHGYLGQLLLPGISHVIGVRVIADLEVRLRAVMQQQNLARADALAYLKKVDKERREWTRFLFEVEWDDPSLYDLVLNLSRMSLETASEQLAHLTERAEFQPTAASVKAMQDLTLSSRVLAALGADYSTRDAELKVTATDGIVTITGSTPTREVTEAVPLVVRQVEGVKGLNYGVKEVPTLHRIE